jgi:tetratricopeptide (TPR) repeat protein
MPKPNMYAEAQRLNEAGEFAASSAELHTLLASLQGTTGTGADDIQAKVFGLLGTNAIHLGIIPEALRYTEEALQRCVASGDREGVWIYTENLETILVAKEVSDDTTIGEQLTHARERIAFAQDLSDAGRYPASNDVLNELLDEVTNNHTAGSRYLGKLYGLLGLNYFRLGDLSAARRFTVQALAESRQRQDIVGDRIYSANLKAISKSERPDSSSS